MAHRRRPPRATGAEIAYPAVLHAVRAGAKTRGDVRAYLDSIGVHVSNKQLGSEIQLAKESLGLTRRRIAHMRGGTLMGPGRVSVFPDREAVAPYRYIVQVIFRESGERRNQSTEMVIRSNTPMTKQGAVEEALRRFTRNYEEVRIIRAFLRAAIHNPRARAI